jgi:hypothetical protein
LKRHESKAQQIESAVQRPDAPICEVADIRREPEQAIANADLFGERDDLSIALEEMMVKALDRGAHHREGIRLSAEPLAALPERDLMSLLRQAEGGGQPGDAAADDGNTRAATR